MDQERCENIPCPTKTAGLTWAGDPSSALAAAGLHPKRSGGKEEEVVEHCHLAAAEVGDEHRVAGEEERDQMAAAAEGKGLQEEGPVEVEENKDRQACAAEALDDEVVHGE